MKLVGFLLVGMLCINISGVQARRFKRGQASSAAAAVNADEAVVSAFQDPSIQTAPLADAAPAEEALGAAAVAAVAIAPPEAADSTAAAVGTAAVVDSAAAVETASELAQAQVVVAAAVTVDAVVIGAGLAGLKAASDLKSKGYNVVLLEGRGRIGGRVYSAALGTGTTSVEVGAQWFHGNASGINAVYDLARTTLGIMPVKTGDTSILRYTGNSSVVPAATVSSFWDTYTAWEASVSGNLADSVSVQGTITSYINANTLSAVQKQGLAFYVNTEIEQEFGASASWLSYNLYDEGKTLTGGDHVMPLGKNLSQITAYLASNLAGAIKFNHNVTKVAYSSSGVTVTAVSSGTTNTFNAKFAIVAVPLGVLKQRGASFFSPTLPKAQQDAISNLRMGLLNKVILEFPKNYSSSGPFGKPDNGSYWINRLPLQTGDNGYHQEIFSIKKAIGAPVLVVFQAGQPAINAENGMNDTATVASVMAQLRTWYGANMPNPINSLVTRWWNDPWTFGSYSYQSTSCTGSDRTNLASAASSLLKRVWFAGEHVSVDYPATMQGAFTTGKAAAASAASAYPMSG